MTTTAKYDPVAWGWSERAYADAAGYLSRRADLVVSLGPALRAGDTVLDLACADGGLGEALLARGLRYLGVDLSGPMVEAARARLGDRASLFCADLNDFRPPQPVAATTCFRALYYARDLRAFFRHVAGFTDRKLVFDLDPRRYRLDQVRADLERAGFDRLHVRPFFYPQRLAPPLPLAALLRVAERTGPLARLLLRFRFSYVCAASRSGR